MFYLPLRIPLLYHSLSNPVRSDFDFDSVTSSSLFAGRQRGGGLGPMSRLTDGGGSRNMLARELGNRLTDGRSSFFGF